MFTQTYWTKEKVKQKIKIGESANFVDNICFLQVILHIGDMSCIQLQKS